ncbi:hypothetical protein FB2170_12876 [Maribacter sp. HTCC2170]|nr:hypothetical protein FB2170_12876 [Maribacter sp. HTCC2170]
MRKINLGKPSPFLNKIQSDMIKTKKSPVIENKALLREHYMKMKKLFTSF